MLRATVSPNANKANRISSLMRYFFICGGALCRDPFGRLDGQDAPVVLCGFGFGFTHVYPGPFGDLIGRRTFLVVTGVCCHCAPDDQKDFTSFASTAFDLY